MDAASRQRRNVLLVGSLGVDSAAEAFQSLAATVGDLAKRYPDGEPGPRKRWVMWQAEMLDRHPQFEAAEEKRVGSMPLRQRTLKAGVNPKDVVFDRLGYADEAIKSYATFQRLKKDGVVPASVRFQVSLPTPTCFVVAHIVPSLQTQVEAAYERALRKEIEQIAAHVPVNQLAVQWDVAHEIVALDGGMKISYEPTTASVAQHLLRLAALVPEGAELGFHFCYGDPGHKHIIEPKDLATCVALANELAERCTRRIDWIHMPVPRNRQDDAYFAPLESLRLKSGTELNLGLIHLTDGADGTRKRIAAAQKHAGPFGVSTECGFGRRPADTVLPLLKLHAEIAKAG